MTTRVDEIVGEGVHTEVDGAVLSIERPLPFICVVRDDADVKGLVAGQGSYLFGDAPEVLARVVRELTERFGAMLVLELRRAEDATTFRVHASDVESTTVNCLRDALGESEVVASDRPSDVLSPDDVRKTGCVLIGLDVPAMFADPDTGERLPLVYRELQRHLNDALHRAFFEFATVQTSLEVKDYRALGRAHVGDEVVAVDRALVEIAEDLDFLLSVTPVNSDEAWAEFQASGHEKEPAFHYRPLRVDPDELKRRLFAIDIEAVEDPTLGALFREKRHELDRLATMLEARGTPAFFGGSLQVYGDVSEELLAFAEAILTRLRGAEPATTDGEHVGAEELARRAREELASYGLPGNVEVRDDVPGILVDEGDVLIGSRLSIAAERVDGLLAHEVGTHVVTYANGASQRLGLLQSGLPGYEETQEGLATLAEYVCGGVTAPRLATIAGRVVAVAALCDGADFVETFRVLTKEWAFSPGAAFPITSRVHRCSGLTKDAMYLRGLSEVLGYVSSGGDVEVLLVGKLPLADVRFVEELLWRTVVRPAKVRPRWLEMERMDEVRKGKTVSDLADEVCA